MYHALRHLLDGDQFNVVERFDLSGRSSRHGDIPRFLFDSRLGIYLHRKAKEENWPGALWSHQAEALAALGRGEHVVISTGTASGKSLVFRTLAFHKCLLEPGSRVLVFYPLKALAADQVRGWKEMADSLGIPEQSIGRIDGSVNIKEREAVLDRAQVVVMTPDVCHAWLMSRLSLPVIKKFVRSLSTLVMDEAHTLEGVFGSNFAFLIRRLIAARNHLLQDDDGASPLQLVAATATIENPAEHLKQLTGSDFNVVDHTSDGAQQRERIVAHIECAEGEEFQVATALHEHVLEDGTSGGFITFLDSRKGVERLALQSGNGQETQTLGDLLSGADVLPYRAGYDATDRTRIEQRLKAGTLRGIVSTSALELGIDIPHLSVGFNIGVPVTRKAYRQRLGRVGRSGPGAFIIIAPRHAFSAYGTSFREYHEMSVEPSYLYLDNRFMQFAHGRCLAVELESLGASSSTPTRVAWPSGFREMHAAARPGGRQPPEYDAVAALGADAPHYGYPLRNVGEINFQIKLHSEADSFGDVNQLHALRECYPGATYLHLSRAYEVQAWHTGSFESFIRVKGSTPFRSTRPRIRTWIHAGIASVDLQENRLVRDEAGFLAECQMQITERVEGYHDSRTGRFHPYSELQQRNPNMRARMRNFRTSGVVLCLRKQWFANASIRCALADWIRDVFVREYSIAPQDVGSAGTNISVVGLDGGRQRGSCIAIYDETYGSLRLTEKLYLDFEHVLGRLSAAVESGSLDTEEQFEEVIPELQQAISAFSETSSTPEAGREAPRGYEQVFTPGSLVHYRESGQMGTDVRIIQPTMMDEILRYQVELPARPGTEGGKRWVTASAVQPSAMSDAWEYAWWNRETEMYEDPPDTEPNRPETRGDSLD